MSRSPHSTVPVVRVVIAPVVHCSECGVLDVLHVARPGADLAAKEHLATHAPRRSE